MKKLILTLSILSCFNTIANSNDTSVWQDFGQNAKNLGNDIEAKVIIKQRRLILDESLLKNRLNSPLAKDVSAKKIASKTIYPEIKLPLPDGSFVRVKAIITNVISPAMAEAHPEIKTWSVTGIDNPKINGVIDFTSNGFHGMLLMPDGDTIFIDPDTQLAGDVYNSFSKKENSSEFDVELNCGIHEAHEHDNLAAKTEFAVKSENKALDSSNFPNLSIADIKTYRLALSATAEYTDSQGGTAGARSSMVTSVNRINPIFTRDLGVSLELIDAPELIFSNSASDPFSDPNNPNTLMRENGDYLSDQGRLDDFDLGHVVSYKSNGGGSGVAFLEVACRNDVNTSNLGLIKGLKAAGATTASNPSDETFDLVLLAHELGHQLGANHSFNSNQGNNCNYGRTGEVAVEPGSGSSIMSYSGLCGSDNLLENPRDDFFHFASITQINQYTRASVGASCGTNSSSGAAPTANAGANLKIPANTPFLLDGTASGGSSSWDQIDIGSASAVDVDTGDNAIIRHNIPSSEQDRYIPNLQNLFAGISTKGEILPQTTRELNFSYVVRNGGVASDRKLINVTNTNSTFSIVSHSSGQTITTNQSEEFIWNPAVTNQAPISCSNVDIQLIRVNGVKNMLLASTPNDGSQNVVIPSDTPTMSGARIFIGCSDNSFFNISSGNIIVQQGAATADTTNPVITIQGTNPTSIVKGTSYTDAGATATDDIDGTITVTSTGSVNSNVVGTYNIQYSATDAAGNNSSATRIVNVTMSESEPADTIAPVITLNGESSINIVKGTNYSDAGASATDNVDGTVTVSKSGIVDTNTVGAYSIGYTAVDVAGNVATATRYVAVTAPPSSTPDTTVPVISLIGQTTVNIQKGSSYDELGATGFDETDGNVNVVITGLVDTNVVGTYTVSYTVTDAAGNTNTEQRTIIVSEDSGQNPGNELNGNGSGGGGGSFSNLLLPLLILLGLRRPKPVRIKTKK